MRTAKVKVFSFKELKTEVKDKVIEKMCDINVDYAWYEGDLDYFKEKLAEMGISCETFYFSLGRDYYIYMHKPSIVNDEKFFKAFKITKKQQKKIENFSIETALYAMGRGKNYIEADYLSDTLTEKLNEILQGFLSDLQKQEEYLTSEEAIIETIEANEYEFRENGEIFRE